MRTGRPLKFKTPQEIEIIAQSYFDSCRELKEPITITGLALALDTSRETLMNYEARDDFFDTIKKIKLVCENYAEKRIFGNNPVGGIFALKNYGWKDKNEVDNNISGGLNITWSNDNSNNPIQPPAVSEDNPQ